MLREVGKIWKEFWREKNMTGIYEKFLIKI